MPRVFINLEAGCLQVNLMSTSTQINQLKYTILCPDQLLNTSDYQITISAVHADFLTLLR